MKSLHQDIIAGVLGLLIVLSLGLLVNNRLNAKPMGTEGSKQVAPNTDVEKGKVSWLRDLEKAKAKSKESGKPIFLQFQEIPG